MAMRATMHARTAMPSHTTNGNNKNGNKSCRRRIRKIHLPVCRSTIRDDSGDTVRNHEAAQRMAERLLEMDIGGNGRTITVVGLAGIPGSGKTTTSEMAVQLANASAGGGDAPFIVLPMDGFHLRKEQLRDSRMRRRRGAHFTFDAEALVAKIRELKQMGTPLSDTESVGWPSFDHSIGDPRPDDIQVRAGVHRVAVIEGLYMLLGSGPWAERDPDAEPTDAALFKFWDALRDVDEGLLDARWWVSCSRDTAMERVVRRHMRANGDTEESARTRVEGNDRRNADLILSSVVNDIDANLVDCTFDNSS